MTNGESDYAKLLPIRDEVFPTFAVDQDCAAAAIVESISDRMFETQINAVVDLGCGTAEILDSMRKQLFGLSDRQIRFLGIDCCAAEIAIARKMRKDCEFIEQRAEHFMGAIVNGGRDLPAANTLLMCIGHTLTHFHSVGRFLDDVASWRPALLLIDFFEDWNSVVHHFDRPDASPIQQLKQSRHSVDGSLVTHTLTTKPNPDDAERLLRGVETFIKGAATTVPFWTTQLRKGTEWFLTEIERRGYIMEKTLVYKSGFGPMTGFLLARGGN